MPQFIKLAEEGHLLSYVNAIREFALANDVPCLDVYAFWEQMEQAGTDIHSLLSNGINHPDPEFHIRLGKAAVAKRSYLRTEAGKLIDRPGEKPGICRFFSPGQKADTFCGKGC